MDVTVGDIVGNVAASIVVALAAFTVGLLAERYRGRRALDHMKWLVGRAQNVQIVLPSFGIESLPIPHLGVEARFPANVMLMPMAEGVAIAKLTDGIRAVSRRCSFRMHPATEYDSSAAMTFCIGGPSVNAVSRKIIEEQFSEFEILYPEHEGRYGSTHFRPRRDTEDTLREDYGFVFVHWRSPTECSVILCGVWAMGTDMAARGLLELGKHHDALALLRERKNCLFTYYGKVEGFTGGEISLIETRSL